MIFLHVCVGVSRCLLSYVSSEAHLGRRLHEIKFAMQKLFSDFFPKLHLISFKFISKFFVFENMFFVLFCIIFEFYYSLSFFFIIFNILPHFDYLPLFSILQICKIAKFENFFAIFYFVFNIFTH